LEGKPMDYVFHGLRDVPMRVNRMNVEAIKLLSQQRNFEADLLLRQALALDPRNAFTLNNLGVAKEATGDDDAALRYYTAAANAHSGEPIVLTLKDSWKGRPLSALAADSARRLKRRIEESDPAARQSAMFTLRGVYAANGNDWQTARKDFLQAYSLKPDNAFSLNNLGYIAEKDGDLETAQLMYAKAHRAADPEARIGLATQLSAEGKPLASVAKDSDQKVDREIDQSAQAVHRETGPVRLMRRDNTPVEPNATPAQPPQ
jgi:Flp pilus assembly protein TadD